MNNSNALDITTGTGAATCNVSKPCQCPVFLNSSSLWSVQIQYNYSPQFNFLDFHEAVLIDWISETKPVKFELIVQQPVCQGRSMKPTKKPWRYELCQVGYSMECGSPFEGQISGVLRNQIQIYLDIITFPTSSSVCIIFLIRAGGKRALYFFFLLGIISFESANRNVFEVITF